jgi:hypothetical protein
MAYIHEHTEYTLIVEGFEYENLSADKKEELMELGWDDVGIGGDLYAYFGSEGPAEDMLVRVRALLNL